MRRNVRTRIGSILLAALMLLTLLPVNAMAAGGEGEPTTVGTLDELKTALTAAISGDTIQLTADITLDDTGLPGTAISGKELTIDGNNKKISFAYTQGNPLLRAVFGNDTNPLYADTNLTVKNLTIENTGDQGGYAAMVGYNANGANINFEGCTFKNLYAAAYVNPVTATPENGVSLSITSCTYEDTLHGYAVDTISAGGYQVVDVTFENNTGEFADSEPVKNVVYATVDNYKKAFNDLAAAVAAADEGSTIELAEGEYTLTAGNSGYFAIDKQLNIKGAGKGETVLTGAGLAFGFGDGDVTVSDLTMEGTGEATAINFQGAFVADGTTATGATYTVENCAFKNYQYTIGVNSYVSGSELVLNACDFVNTGCAAAIQDSNTITADENNTISGGYAVQSFGGSGEDFHNGFYKGFDITGEPDLDATKNPIIFVNANGTDLENGAKLQAAVDSAADNAVIYVTAGDYDVTHAGDATASDDHNLLITNDNLTIIGEDGAKIFATYTSQVGDAQQTIKIKSADNVTLQNLTVNEMADYANKAVEVEESANAVIENCTIYAESSGVYIGGKDSVNYTVKNNTIVGGGICITNGAGGQEETAGNCIITGNTITGPILLNGLGSKDNSYAWMKYDLRHLPTIEDNTFEAPETASGMVYYLRSLSYKDSGTAANPVAGMGPMEMVSQDYVNNFIKNNTFEGNDGYIYMMYPGNENFAYYGAIATGDMLAKAIANAQDGDTITLGKGEFTVSNAIILDKKLTIQGSGEETVIIGDYVQNYGNGLFTFTGGSEGTVLKDMTIQYTESGTQQAAVYFDYGFTGGSADEVTKIQNVHFIGGEGLDSIGGAMAIGSTYTTGGFVEISGCQIENFKYGMYFNAMHDLSITNNTIDGTSYNAINIAGDGETSCENITIEEKF
jgi:hypothetical protein